MMNKGKFPFKRWIIKSIINLVAFCSLLVLLTFTELPEKFDSYIYYKDFKLNSWILLVVYRIIIYFLYPILASWFEGIFLSRKCVPYKYRLLENFNVQFFVYTFTTALYSIFGVDKILGTEIFGSSDSFMFIGSFIFTLMINKIIPYLFYDGNVDNITYYRKIFDSVDLNTIRYDSDPFSNSRNFLSYEYNNVDSDKELVVVLKNPSKSLVNGDAPSKIYNCIDTATYNVMKTIDNYNKTSSNKYGKVTILTLFPEFTTDSENLNSIYKFKKGKNISPNTRCFRHMHKLIEKKINTDCNVLFAWGNNDEIYSTSYDLAIEKMKEHFVNDQKFEFDGSKIVANNTNYPLEAKMWD